MKKRRPIDVMNETDPDYEHLMIKYPGEEIQDISGLPLEKTRAYTDKEKLRLLNEAHKNKKYSLMHNHTRKNWWEIFHLETGAAPSIIDWNKFIADNNCRTTYIIQRNRKTGEEEGRYVIRKPKDFYWSRERGPFYHDDIITFETKLMPLNTTIDVANKYGLKFKAIPANGYRMNWRGIFSRDKKSGNLEKSLEKVIGILSIGLSIIFLSNNITGYSILEIQKNNSDIIGTILFILGLLLLFVSKRK